MENFNDNNGSYDIDMQGIKRKKTRTYQEVCIYPEKECLLYEWYWYMAYTYIIDHSNEECIFPEFAKTVCKIGESRIDSRVSIMFRKIYEQFYKLVQKCGKGQ